jgi:hypothetical protein
MSKRRIEYNREILVKLLEFFEKYPDTRFVQGLYSLKIIEDKRDDFNTESSKTLNTINENFS